MQKLFRILDKKSVSLFIGAAVFILVFAPGTAHADLLVCGVTGGNKNIFGTMACKITTTLFDIRKIIYVVAGFGLIAFTFAAIFNKISFKHLAHIALSLFLLSMMTPFIEYFTGAPSEKALEFGKYLPPSFSQDDYSTTFGECGANCPKSTTGGASGSGLGSGLGSGSGADSSVLGGAAGERMAPIAPIASLSSPPLVTSGAGASGLQGLPALPTSPTEAADTRSNWQKIKDGIKTVATEAKKAYATTGAIVAGASAVVKGTKTISNSVKNIGSIEGAITAATTGAHEVNRMTGAVTSAAGTYGVNYGNREGERTAGERAADAFKGVDNAMEDTKSVSGDAGAINGVATGIPGLFDDIKNLGR